MVVVKDRLLKPRLQGKRGFQITDDIDSGLPLNYFLQSRPSSNPSRRFTITAALRRRLQMLAIERGHGREADNWKELVMEDRPHWWDKRNTAKAEERERPHHVVASDRKGASYSEGFQERQVQSVRRSNAW